MADLISKKALERLSPMPDNLLLYSLINFHPHRSLCKSLSLTQQREEGQMEVDHQEKHANASVQRVFPV